MLITDDFVLIHIPKTGGTFLNELIRKHCEVRHFELHRPYSDVPAEFRQLPALAYVRNPWDWYVSWFVHQKEKGPVSKDEWPYQKFEIATASFSRFLRLAFDLPSGFDFYSAQVRVASDGCEIGRFESLREDFLGFLDRHGLEHAELRAAVLSAPPVNIGNRGAYQDYYDEASRELVAGSWLATNFGYEWEGASPERPHAPQGATQAGSPSR